MSETEKITINMGAVDLGKVDLLVREGLYSNRSDFIRTAIRAQIEKHGLEVQQSVARHAYVIGALSYNRRMLERMRSEKEKLHIAVLGSLHIAKDVPAELAAEVVERIKVRGMFSASDAVKAALADRLG